MSRLLALVALVVSLAAPRLLNATEPSFTPQATDCYFVDASVPVLAPSAHFCPPPTTIGIPRT